FDRPGESGHDSVVIQASRHHHAQAGPAKRQGPVTPPATRQAHGGNEDVFPPPQEAPNPFCGHATSSHALPRRRNGVRPDRSGAQEGYHAVLRSKRFAPPDRGLRTLPTSAPAAGRSRGPVMATVRPHMEASHDLRDARCGTYGRREMAAAPEQTALTPQASPTSYRREFL